MDQPHLQEQIEMIARHEQEFYEARTAGEKISGNIGSFVGSFQFVLLHLIFFAAWVVFNATHATARWRFDTYPFPMLDTVLAVEAIFLASFILMRQASMGRRSDERDHLVLQLLLLTEKETTKLLEVNREIAARLGLHSVARDTELAALSEETPIDEVADSIRESLPPEE